MCKAKVCLDLLESSNLETLVNVFKDSKGNLNGYGFVKKLVDEPKLINLFDLNLDELLKDLLEIRVFDSEKEIHIWKEGENLIIRAVGLDLDNIYAEEIDCEFVDKYKIINPKWNSILKDITIRNYVQKNSENGMMEILFYRLIPGKVSYGGEV